jgi:hypothetical protein
MNIRKWNKNGTEDSNRAEELCRDSTLPCDMSQYKLAGVRVILAKGDDYCGTAEPCPVAIIDFHLRQEKSGNITN